MGIALLFLGLLPLVFFGDVFVGGDPSTDGDLTDDPGNDAASDPATDPTTTGDFLDAISGGVQSGTESGLGTETGNDAEAAGDAAGTDANTDTRTDPAADAGNDPAADTSGDGTDNVLTPVEDDPPPQSDPVDPATVLTPVQDDPAPGQTPIDPGTVIGPNEDPSSDYPTDGDGTLLQRLLNSETDANTGAGYVGTQIGSGDETDTVLTAGDDTVQAPDDGVNGTGTGALDTWDGTPVLRADTVDVISGTAGNDNITTGDNAAYAFGGAGNDTLTAGEGVAALFGGVGSDTLVGNDTSAGAYLDGGAGNDVIRGGDAGETLQGGAHGAGDENVQDDDTISGGGGNDIIRGGFGADTLSGGDGNDVIDHLGRAEEQVHWERSDFAWHIDNQADTLDGGAGNDTLIMDRADTATGGDGADTFWVYHDEATGSGAAEVTDFQPGVDFLHVDLNPELGPDTPSVDVGPSQDGHDGVVRVNGNVVAILRGAPDATDADVYAEVVDNVFA
jgi:Ca2+-binding RTX toxin-like protein